MMEIARTEAHWVSVGPAKNVFQIHVETVSGRLMSAKTLRRDRLLGHLRSDPISRWVLALKERAARHKAVVALANKNARILWAVMTREQRFDRHHISVKPA
jgi:hypothetical protein